MNPAKIEELRELRAMWEAAPDGSDEKGLLGFRLMDEAFEALPHFLAAASQDSLPAASSYIEVRTSACHAGSDGDCSWSECPQTRDGEPAATGRHCPLRASPECLHVWEQSAFPGVRGWYCMKCDKARPRLMRFAYADPAASSEAAASPGDEG